jgi:hypothetical protein
LNLKDGLAGYKLNDVYVLEEWNEYDPKIIFVQKTYMDLPVKYKVVYISPQGVPHLRQITIAGKPTGDVIFPPEIAILRLMRMMRLNDKICFRFAPDPEQLDAILLEQEFDPMEQQRTKSKLFNEINKHNKRVQIPTDYCHYDEISKFFKTRKSGDKFWTSPDKQFVIQSVTKIGKEWIIDATNMNQTTLTFDFRFFWNKRLYKEQPRSFVKESKV